MYYPIDENAARAAHSMNSFFTFTEGKATERYQRQVDSAAALAAKKKNRVELMLHAKIDSLLATYSRKLADWYNKSFAIESRCPSWPISGGGNFPVRKKEKQNAARDRHMREYNVIKNLLTQMDALGTCAINSDDPDALMKLKDKLASLKQNHVEMKAVNAYYRKHKTLDGCPGLTDEIRSALERYTHQGVIPTCRLSYNLAEIKRVKQRIAALEHPLQGWTFEGGEVVANAEANRLQIVFAEKPDETLRTTLKKRGFRWSPRFHAWQRQLNNNAVHAAKHVLAAHQ